MKRFLSAIVMICAAWTLSAQTANEMISYQSVLRNAENRLLHDTTVNVTVTITSDSGSYSEEHTVKSNANGLISFLIGNGTNKSGAWDAVDWRQAEATIVSKIGNDAVATNSMALSAVPLSLFAKDAATAAQAAYADSADINIVKRYVDAQGFLTEIPANVATTDGDNVFTGSSTVPRGFDEKTTTAANCNNVIVNACDLYAAFDSLGRRMDSISNELTAAKNSLNAMEYAPFYIGLEMSGITTTSADLSANFISVGSDISEYEIQYSTDNTMANAEVTNSTTPEITLSGLAPYTEYYVTVTASNETGETTSKVLSFQTKANAPTGQIEYVHGLVDGIELNLSNIDFKEPGTGKIEVYCSDVFVYELSGPKWTKVYEISDYTSDMFNKRIKIDESNFVYTKVVLTNTDGMSATLFDMTQVNTREELVVTLTAEPTEGYLCDGEPVVVHYFASVNIVAQRECEYTWSDGIGVGGNNTISYNSAGQKELSCTATYYYAPFDYTSSAKTITVNILPCPRPTYRDVAFQNIGKTSADVEADFLGNGINYEFRYSKNSDMSESSSIQSYDYLATLSNLEPGTVYYVVVTATNKHGSATSPVKSFTTQSDAVTLPSYSNISASKGSQEGKIKVTITNLDFKEPGTGTVKVYYRGDAQGEFQLGGTFDCNSSDEKVLEISTNYPDYEDFEVKVVIDNGSGSEVEWTSGNNLIYVGS